MTSIRAKLHPLYARLVSDFFDGPGVEEHRATCDTCAMCDHGQGVDIAIDFFEASAKCCTYYPTMPNYLVGALLADDAADVAEGRRRMQEIIRSRRGVTPQWIAPPRKTTLLMSSALEAFGRSTVFRCPFYDESVTSNNCTIWRHRENVCWTYHCKYTNGRPGWQYWTALRDYFGHVERALARYAALAIDETVLEPNIRATRLTREDIEDKPPIDSEYARYWGSWVGREEEFYVACFERVRTLVPAEFRQNVDDSQHGRGFLGKLHARREGVDRHVIPAKLIRNKRLRQYPIDGAVVVSSFNPYDSFKLDSELFEVLGKLDAEKSLTENLRSLESEGIELSDELVEQLFVHDILVPPNVEATGSNHPQRPTAPTVTASADASADATKSGAGASKKKQKKRSLGRR